MIMVLSMAGKSDVNASNVVAVVGNSVAAIQAALTLARMGVEVKIITNAVALGWNSAARDVLDNSPPDQRFLYPLLLQAANHSLITMHTGAEVESMEGETGDFKIKVIQRPRYVHEAVCTGCGRCEAECSVNLTSLFREQKIKHG